MTEPSVIHIVVENVPGGRLLATSKDLKGLMVAGASIEDLVKRIPPAMQDLLAALERPSVVCHVPIPEKLIFVAIPCEQLEPLPERACA